MTNTTKTNKNTGKKALKKSVRRWRGYGIVTTMLCMLLMGTTAFMSIKADRAINTSHADEMYSADGIKLADYWIEPINDGSGRYILHVEAANEDFDVLACEISCDPSFNSSEVFTFGALAQDGSTSYTNEVVSLDAGSTLYIRVGDMVYTLDVPGGEEDEEVIENYTSVPAATATPAATPTATATPSATKTSVTAENKKTDTESSKKSTSTDVTSSKKNETNETIINRTIVNEKIVDKETEEKKETGFVYVSYLNEEGQKLSATLEIKGSIGLAYSAEEKSFDGYKLVSVDGNKSGKVQKDTQYVVFHYESTQKTEVKDPEKKETGFVYVSYVTEDGKNLAASLEISGEVGTQYTAEEKSFDGYELKTVEGNTAGTITAEIQTVKFVYAEKAEEPVEPEVKNGTVNVSYETEDGTVLSSEVITDEVGTSYTAEEKSFDGYELKAVEGNATGIITAESQAVKFVYAEKKAEHVCNYVIVEHSEETCTSDGYTIYACECGESYKETIPAHGHSMEVYLVTEEFIESHCKECGAVDKVYSEVLTTSEEETVTTNNATANDEVIVNETADDTAVEDGETETVDESANADVDAENNEGGTESSVS